MKRLLFPLLFFSLANSSAQPIDQTLETLGEALEPVSLTMPFEEFMHLKPGLFSEKEAGTFQSEIAEKLNRHGLNAIRYSFQNGGDNPLFQFSIEFENAKLALEIAAADLGQANHPTAANCWILFAERHNPLVMLAWVAAEKMVMATNLPGTAHENDPRFRLPDDFDYPSIADHWSPSEMTGEDKIEFSKSLEIQLSAAADQFKSLRGELLGEVGSGVVDCKMPLNIAEFGSIGQNDEGKWVLVNNLAAEMDEQTALRWAAELASLLEKTGLQNFRLQPAGSTNEGQMERISWVVLAADGKLAGLEVAIVRAFWPDENGWAIDVEIMRE